MNKSLFRIVVAAALGGLLFGFDSGVISGCEKAIQNEFALPAFWHGLIIAGALIGTVIGVFTAGAPSDRWGRRWALWLMGVLFLVSAVGCAFTPRSVTWGPHVLGWFRFIGGLAIGGVSVVVPLYIVELAPGHLRGRLVAVNQLNIVLGIVVSYVTNYLVARYVHADPGIVWRVMLGVEIVPILLFMAMLTTVPESPRWLVRVNREDEARKVLERIGYPNVVQTLKEIRDSLSSLLDIESSAAQATQNLKQLKTSNPSDIPLFQRRYLKPILLAFFIAFFNQMSGINAINYYAPRIFQMIFGEGSELASLAGTIGLGLVNLVFTALAFLVIDRFGRRILIIGGSLVMIAMHGLVAWQLSLAHPNEILACAGIFGFIAFFAISSGACIWVYISEVFPNVVRAKGQALGCFTHWFLCMVVSWLFPAVAERAGMYAFAFFAFMMAVQLVWAIFFMPETKGGTIEDIEKRLGIGA